MNTFDTKYKNLIEDVLNNGTVKGDRTGTGTLSVFHRTLEHDMKEGFPMLTLRKIHWNNVVTELLWFLKGRTDLKYLLENDNKIWVGDAYKRYCSESKDSSLLNQRQFCDKILMDLKFSEKWGDLGPIYGKQWRAWQDWIDVIGSHMTAKGSIWIDQIGILIQDLKTNPDSRRLMVSAWNVGDVHGINKEVKAILPPCHYGFQCYVREMGSRERFELYQTGKYCGPYESPLEIFFPETGDKNPQNIHDWLTKFAPNVPTRALSLKFNLRSNDLPLGNPTNMASYGLLLELLALEVGMEPDRLICDIGDAHIYLNQVEQMKELIKRESFELPNLEITKLKDSNMLMDYEKEHFKLLNYQHGPLITIPLSN